MKNGKPVCESTPTLIAAATTHQAASVLIMAMRTSAQKKIQKKGNKS